MSLTSVTYVKTLQKIAELCSLSGEESFCITNNSSVLQSTPEVGHVIHIAVCLEIAIMDASAFK